MMVVDTVAGLMKATEEARSDGRRVGLVPTMGALHPGHLSLLRRSVQDDDTVVATVFVNPLQFAAGEDLASYPRDLRRDLVLADEAGVDYLFVPTCEEMYSQPPLITIGVAALSQRLDGRYRPGHFEGVAMVIAKLFAMVGRCRAYFGEKDYQQLCLVRRLAADLSFPVEVVGCPTVRHPDGLALSSRNVRLSPTERVAAPVIHRALVAGRRAVEAGRCDPAVVSQVMADVMSGEPLADLEYAEAADPGDLRTPDRLAGEVRLLAAARIGAVRLIDNLAAVFGQPRADCEGRSHSQRRPHPEGQLCDGG